MLVKAKPLAVGMLAIGLLFGGAAAAHAGTTLYSFNELLPSFQFPTWTPNQTKAISSYPGLITDSSTDTGYKYNAKLCVHELQQCGSQVFGISGGNFSLPNSIAAGTTSVSAQLWNFNYTVVRTSVTGYYASN